MFVGQHVLPAEMVNLNAIELAVSAGKVPHDHASEHHSAHEWQPRAILIVKTHAMASHSYQDPVEASCAHRL
jgi:hypothetical protein